MQPKEKLPERIVGSYVSYLNDAGLREIFIDSSHAGGIEKIRFKYKLSQHELEEAINSGRIKDGFITSRNNKVTREEAKEIAQKAEQLTEEGKKDSDPELESNQLK